MYTHDMFLAIPKYEDITYKYVYNFDRICWNVVMDSDIIASIDAEDSDKFLQSSNVFSLDVEILEDFRKFMKRPEYKIMNFDIPSELNQLQDSYEELLVSSICCREISKSRDINSVWPYVDKALRWLRTTDFYTAPASSRFHESFKGGLCFHSLKVAKRTVELMHSDKFQYQDKLGSAVLCALTHDWCKIGLYESYMKNVKNENTGVWEKELAYRYKGESMINLGHGVSSMFLVSKFFKLTLEEASAIRWHMGAYRTDSNEFNELQSSNENYPLCYILQFADQLSLAKY